MDILEDELRVEPHQKLYALHADTDNLHLHVILNRVHPDTVKVEKINGGFDIRALHRACARIDHAQGWKSERKALYRVNEDGNVVPTSTEQREHGGKPTQSQIDQELRTGQKSAARIAIEIAGPILKESRSWSEVHERLSHHGMRYHKTGSGATIQVGDVRVKASTVSRSATLLRLEKRLGPYVPPNASILGKDSGELPEESTERPASKSAPDPKAAWPFIKEARAWKELHRTLADHDVRYEKFGSGATIFAGEK